MNLLVPQLSTFDPNPSLQQPVLICFSHLRWDFVLQRPQHLMNRFSQYRQVFFFEEHIPCDHHLPYLELHPFADTAVISVRPRIPRWFDDAARDAALGHLLDQLLVVHRCSNPVLWFITPMMYPFARHIDAAAVIYDCMDELANFRFAPPQMRDAEAQLLARADLVFTGGYSLYEAKRMSHDNIHPAPSGVDIAHFAAARTRMTEPQDQAKISGPKLGFYGVLDERLDVGLIADVATARPEWSLILIGPVVKISPEDLPKLPNVHYLGPKSYQDLPAYLSGWDVALLPFAINDATRFISPTKTPEYLAAGRPVVSTAITDVVRRYGAAACVGIARTHDEFIACCEHALAAKSELPISLQAIDALLSSQTWDETFNRMAGLVDAAVADSTMPRQLPLTPPSGRKPGRAPYDVVIVGAGLAGSVMAERLAAGAGKRVLICDRRDHIGGNAYDYYDDEGILVHKYGPHIFHTNSQEIVDYLSRFTDWRPYEHRVLASIGDQLLPLPINRTTLNLFYGLDLTCDAEAEALLAEKSECLDTIATSKDVVLAGVGQELYRAFFEGYTRKQWGLDPSQLDKSVTARLLARFDSDDRYFLDTFQAMPALGYTHLFSNLLDDDNIDIELSTDYSEIRAERLAPHTIFTGPIDEFFDYRFGPLPYRSLRFQHETLDRRRFQPVAVVNYPAEQIPFTRITEYKHLTGQVHPHTSISYEFPQASGDPFYPIPRPENQALYKQYQALATARNDVTFVGRLATYKYYNMDQVVGQALATYRRLVPKLTATQAAPQ